MKQTIDSFTPQKIFDNQRLFMIDYSYNQTRQMLSDKAFLNTIGYTIWGHRVRGASTS